MDTGWRGNPINVIFPKSLLQDKLELIVLNLTSFDSKAHDYSFNALQNEQGAPKPVFLKFRQTLE